MPTGSITPAGGGTSFNGGTITGGLTIDAPNAVSNVQLLIKDAFGNADPLQIVDGVQTVLNVTSGGVTYIANPNRGAKVLNIDGLGHISGDGDLLFVSNTALPSSALRVDGAGDFIIQGTNAAPASADLNAKECGLWFDSTNGAAKLMVKAKQADGTVVAAAIALS